MRGAAPGAAADGVAVRDAHARTGLLLAVLLDQIEQGRRGYLRLEQRDQPARPVRCSAGVAKIERPAFAAPIFSVASCDRSKFLRVVGDSHCLGVKQIGGGTLATVHEMLSQTIVRRAQQGVPHLLGAVQNESRFVLSGSNVATTSKFCEPRWVIGKDSPLSEAPTPPRAWRSTRDRPTTCQTNKLSLTGVGS